MNVVVLFRYNFTSRHALSFSHPIPQNFDFYDFTSIYSHTILPFLSFTVLKSQIV